MINNIKKAAFSFNEKYVSQALNEIKGSSEALKNAGLKYIGGAVGGFQLAEFETGRTELVSAIKSAELVFVRHCCTYEYEYEIQVDTEPISELADLLIKRMGDNPDLTAFSIQGRAFEQKEKALLDSIREELEEKLLSEGKTLEVKYPEQIISLYLKDNVLMAGVGLPSENLSRWSGGMAHYKQETWEVSRSMYKLMEAFEVFQITTAGGEKVLDLGASPGGWSSVMMRRGMRVTAVDTEEMSEKIKDQKALEFIKANIEEVDLGDKVFDILVSDMSLNATKMAKAFCRAAKWLKDDGYAVVTVKLSADKPVKSLTDVKKIYSEIFEILGCKQLFHNREEVTLYLKKK